MNGCDAHDPLWDDYLALVTVDPDLADLPFTQYVALRKAQLVVSADQPNTRDPYVCPDCGRDTYSWAGIRCSICGWEAPRNPPRSQLDGTADMGGSGDG